MNKIYKGQVNQLRQSLINQIKLMFINPEREDFTIEFIDEFVIWQQEFDTHLIEEPIQVLYRIKGLRTESGQCYLYGLDGSLEEFDDLELESIWDLYELAYVLDALTAGHYKVLVTTEE